MNINRFKKFISVFVVVILLLAFLLPEFDCFVCMAETIIVGTTERKKSRGSKLENAEYWDYNENYDKSRIWIDTGNGGNGSGGGAGDRGSNNDGNAGMYNENGGVFGGAAGSGLGRGNEMGATGVGGSNSGSGSGSAIADALRALKKEIDESRAESLQQVLETAVNQSIVAASIAERESVQESIQRKLAQESIKAKIMPQETQRMTYDMIPDKSVYVPTTRRQVETDVATQAPTTMRQFETYNETLVPTSVRSNPNIYDFVPQTTQHEVFAVEMFKAMQDAQESAQVTLAPTSEYIEKSIVVPPETTFMTSEYEPGDFIESVTNKDIIMPSVEQIIETTVATIESSSIESTTEKNKETMSEEEGEGEKGGDDAEKDEDKKGDDSTNESQGDAKDKGQFHIEDEGKNAGKKVFELDKNGYIGIENKHYSMIKVRDLLLFIIVILFLLGFVTYFMRIRDKKNKHNYF